jgi:hypothetical protein
MVEQSEEFERIRRLFRDEGFELSDPKFGPSMSYWVSVLPNGDRPGLTGNGDSPEQAATYAWEEYQEDRATYRRDAGLDP